MEKPFIIPSKVKEMAAAIKYGLDTDTQIYTSSRRRWGRNAAINLALNTEDADFEIIEPLKLPNSEEISTDKF